MCDSDPTLGASSVVVLAMPDSQVDTQDGDAQPLTSIQHDHTYSSHLRLANQLCDGAEPGAEGVLSQELFSGEDEGGREEKCSVEDADMEIVESIGMLGGVANSSHFQDGNSIGKEGSLVVEEDEMVPVLNKPVLQLGNMLGAEPGNAMGVGSEPEVPEANEIGIAVMEPDAKSEVELDSTTLEQELDSTTLEQVKQDFQHYANDITTGEQSAPPPSDHTHPAASGDPLVGQIVELMPVLSAYTGRAQSASKEQLYLLSQQLLEFLTIVNNKRR